MAKIEAWIHSSWLWSGRTYHWYMIYVLKFIHPKAVCLTWLFWLCCFLLFVGGYYGSGRRGGEVWSFSHCIWPFNKLFLCSSNELVAACFSFQVAQFLVGLAERPSPNTHPKQYKRVKNFLSFWFLWICQILILIPCQPILVPVVDMIKWCGNLIAMCLVYSIWH